MMVAEVAREQMVLQQVRAWDVLDQRVLELLLKLPREDFVPRAWRDVACADTEIPLPHGQHMLAPKMVGRILQAIAAGAGDTVLEVGTGSGFLTAALACQARSVRSLEIYPDIAEFARANLKRAGIANATVLAADGSQLAEHDAYDAAVVTASLPLYDERFQQALRIGGRLFVVVGEPPIMEARLVRRVSATSWSAESLFETVLDPLLNARRREAFEF
ncbi:MAG: protein-L-isoaspartate O-methyltransferase [Steroidobacteraceae bacterium]